MSTTETTATMYGGTCTTATSCSGNRVDIMLSLEHLDPVHGPLLVAGATGHAMFNPQHALTIDFQVYSPPARHADFWIDDLSFY